MILGLLIQFTTLFCFAAYQKCYSSKSETCGQDSLIAAQLMEDKNPARCMSFCNKNEDCKFVFGPAESGVKWACLLYRSCNTTRKPSSKIGVTYSKDGKCPGKNTLLSDTCCSCLIVFT